MKNLTALLILLLSFPFIANAQVQKTEWPVPIGLNDIGGNTESFQSEDYIYEIFNRNAGRIFRYDGKKWDSIMFNFGLTDITGNKKYTVVNRYSAPYYHLGIYSDSTKKWDTTNFRLLYPDHTIRNVELYKNDVYCFMQKGPYPYEQGGTIIKYDIKKKTFTKLFDLKQTVDGEFESTVYAINLFSFQGKLYISGSYDQIDGRNAQGLSYYNGSKLNILNMFPSSTQYNVNAEVLSKNELIACFYKANGNDLTGSELYVIKNDKIVENISYNAFTDHEPKQWSGLAYLNHRFTHAFKMNGTVVWPVKNHFMVLNRTKKEWELLAFEEWDLNSHYFKDEYYLTCAGLRFPSEKTDRSGVFKIARVDVYRTYLYADLDKDCELESGDRPLSNHFLRVTGNGYDVSLSSDSLGFVNLYLEDGKYNLDLNSESIDLSKCHSGSIDLNSNKLKGGNLKLAAQFNSKYDNETDFDVTLSNRLVRRGRDFRMAFKIENKGSVTDYTKPVLYYDKRLRLKSVSESCDTSIHGRIKFNLGKVSYFEPRIIKLSFIGHQDSIDADDTLYFKGQAPASMAELDTTNNTEERYVEVRTPYDPNNMISNPGKVVYEAPAYMDYTVNFQNMGKDTAFDVRIIDTLPDHLDPLSIKIIDHSGVEIKSTIENGVLDIFFNEIQLAPKAIDEEASQGFVSFRITFSEPLTKGRSILNNADIYFDFEEPVRTNDAITFHAWPVGYHELSENLGTFPNPATDFISFMINNENVEAVQLFDSRGREMVIHLINENTLDISELQKGIYVIMLSTESATYTKQFTKE